MPLEYPLVTEDLGLLLQLVPASDDVGDHCNNSRTSTSTVATVASDATDATVATSVVPNRHLPASIHPNGHVPDSFEATSIKLLHGGGSGTAVFGGYHPAMGDVVMKHAGAKDAKEVFSLATIACELQTRRHNDTGSFVNNEAAYVAAENMTRRIPTFRMVYISPYHLRDRGKELWARVRNLSYDPLPNAATTSVLAHKPHEPPPLHSQRQSQGGDPLDESRRHSTEAANLSQSDLFKLSKLPASPKPSRQRDSSAYQRTIRLTTNNPTGTHCNQVTWTVSQSSVQIGLPDSTRVDGLALIQAFGHSLIEQLEQHHWKVTIGQKWIGGRNAVNGADVLTRGALAPGSQLLEILHRDVTTVLQDLERLTRLEERTGPYAAIQSEVQSILAVNSSVDVTHVSKRVDVFVGRSIVKNFHPHNGRFVAMRRLGIQFQMATCPPQSVDKDSTDDEGSSPKPRKGMLLLPNEEIPACFLARLLTYQADQSTVFVCPPSTQSAFDAMQDRGWRNLVRDATQFAVLPSAATLNDEHTGSSIPNVSAVAAATDCIWTCGLTDAGLHNSFLSIDRGLEFFDLGEPSVQPRPAFLIKFLMSFFHTLGMEDDGNGMWKVRFEVANGTNGAETDRLAATPETLAQIPYIHSVFTATLDHFIVKMFQGEERVRRLLLKYVVLQLLSDASFCLERWTSKGGGTQQSGNHNTSGSEKWLWRSLWDHYIASYVYTNLLVPTETSLSLNQTSK